MKKRSLLHRSFRHKFFIEMEIFNRGKENLNLKIRLNSQKNKSTQHDFLAFLRFKVIEEVKFMTILKYQEKMMNFYFFLESP
jgi:hypothetical protein